MSPVDDGGGARFSLSPAEILRANGLSAKKHWGQCFLHDPNVVAAIVDAMQIGDDDRVLEIGAGLGVLTAALASRARTLIAIERDRDLLPILEKRFGGLEHVELVAANALAFDYSVFDPRVLVVGNLPYHISSPILFRLLGQRRGIKSATLMLQRELADRIAAGPGSRTYGAPSVICQHYAEVSVCLKKVGRGAFTPAPGVDSSVIKLMLRDGVQTPALFDAVVKAAFGQRRKTLRRALSARFDKDAVAAALADAKIPPDQRAEQLAPATFYALALALGEALAAGET